MGVKMLQRHQAPNAQHRYTAVKKYLHLLYREGFVVKNAKAE
jgi:hypothetical protein